MAITINQQPKSFTPSDNPIVWTFSSNQTAQPNFVYVVKVYINDTLISNELVFPDNGIYGRYDASNHASNYCNLPTIGSAIVADAANYCKVRITIVERYGATPTDGASVVGTNRIAWKAKMFDTDFINWNPTPYTYGSGALWLTNYPDYPSVRLEDETVRLMLINNLNNITLTIYLYDANGDEVNNDVIVSGVGSAFLISILELSPANIISLTGLTTGDFEASAYYEVSIPSSVAAQRISINKSLVYPILRLSDHPPERADRLYGEADGGGGEGLHPVGERAGRDQYGLRGLGGRGAGDDLLLQPRDQPQAGRDLLPGGLRAAGGDRQYVPGRPGAGQHRPRPGGLLPVDPGRRPRRLPDPGPGRGLGPGTGRSDLPRL